METITYLLPALGCAAMMGGMMWMMRRGNNSSDAPRPDATDERQQQLSELRAEIDQLSAENASGEAEVQTGRERNN